MKLVAQDIGRPHVSMDVGCHAFASFEPFSQGNTLLGYGMSLAAAAGVGPMSARRPVSVMGDGGFWHNGLLSGVASNLLNKGDGVLVIMKNGYASATGTQELLSSPPEDARMVAVGESATGADRTIENTLTGLGVKWLRTVNNYDVGAMAKTYREAMTTRREGAEGHRRRGRVPARAAEAVETSGLRKIEERRKTRPRQIRRGRGHLYRRPLVHPALGLPDADGKGQSRSAAPRPGRHRDRRLRRLRPVRRERARRGALPLLLSGRGHAEPHRLGQAPQQDRGHFSMTLPERPITILIAALGGEGGGVMADWLMEAATHSGYPAQATSIPGVAQRTGATTYYLEIYPAQRSALGGKEPVLSLTPSPGNVDVMVASELVEAGRAMLNGFVSPERTTLIASTHRIYATVEKMQMADGRFESARVHDAAKELAKAAVLFDMRALAQESGTVINAVLFGAMAGSGVLPLSREVCEQAIRRGGRGAEASLRGFAAGYDIAARQRPAPVSAAAAETRERAQGSTRTGDTEAEGLPGRQVRDALPGAHEAVPRRG